MEEITVGVGEPRGQILGCGIGSPDAGPQSEGITVIEANVNHGQENNDECQTESIDETCLNDCNLEDCRSASCNSSARSGILCGDMNAKVPCTCSEKKESSSIGAIEFALPDNGDDLSYNGKDIFNTYKSDIVQLVAKEDIHVKYYDGFDTKERVISAGTKGGYVNKGFRVENTWIDSDTIVFGMNIKDCYITKSSILARGHLQGSYIESCVCDDVIELDVRTSSLVSINFDGGECYVDGSFLVHGSIKSSSVKNCKYVRESEIINSYVENINDGYRVIVEGGGIKNAFDDFLQITNVGTSNRILCAYKTPRGGVRVSTGCFRGTLEELAIANAKSHLGYKTADDGYLVKSKMNVTRNNEWCYKEYDMLIKYIKHHFKLDVNTTTIDTNY